MNDHEDFKIRMYHYLDILFLIVFHHASSVCNPLILQIEHADFYVFSPLASPEMNEHFAAKFTRLFAEFSSSSKSSLSASSSRGTANVTRPNELTTRERCLYYHVPDITRPRRHKFCHNDFKIRMYHK